MTAGSAWQFAQRRHECAGRDGLIKDRTSASRCPRGIGRAAQGESLVGNDPADKIDFGARPELQPGGVEHHEARKVAYYRALIRSAWAMKRNYFMLLRPISRVHETLRRTRTRCGAG